MLYILKAKIKHNGRYLKSFKQELCRSLYIFKHYMREFRTVITIRHECVNCSLNISVTSTRFVNKLVTKCKKLFQLVDVSFLELVATWNVWGIATIDRCLLDNTSSQSLYRRWMNEKFKIKNSYSASNETFCYVETAYEYI